MSLYIWAHHESFSVEKQKKSKMTTLHIRLVREALKQTHRNCTSSSDNIRKTLQCIKKVVAGGHSFSEKIELKREQWLGIGRLTGQPGQTRYVCLKCRS